MCLLLDIVLPGGIEPPHARHRSAAHAGPLPEICSIPRIFPPRRAFTSGHNTPRTHAGSRARLRTGHNRPQVARKLPSSGVYDDSRAHVCTQTHTHTHIRKKHRAQDCALCRFGVGVGGVYAAAFSVGLVAGFLAFAAAFSVAVSSYLAT